MKACVDHVVGCAGWYGLVGEGAHAVGALHGDRVMGWGVCGVWFFFFSVVAVGKVCMEADGACMAWGVVECEGSGWSCAVDVVCGVMK